MNLLLLVGHLVVDLLVRFSWLYVQPISVSQHCDVDVIKLVYT